MNIVKMVGFVLFSMWVGFLSGLSHPVLLGARGAILGGMLAMGFLACEAYRGNKGTLSVGVTLTIACVVSLAAALFMEGWAVMIKRFGLVVHDDFNISDLAKVPFGYTFLTCFLIALGIFLCYRSCTLQQSGRLKALFFFGIPSLSVIPRIASTGELDVITIGLFFFVLGLLPFLMMWICAAALFFDFFSPDTHESDRRRNAEGA